MNGALKAGLAVIAAEMVMAGGVLSAGVLGMTGKAYASPQEDSPTWSCVDDGNRICGPGNANHAPPGCYDQGGVIVALWPCHVAKGDVFYGYPEQDGTDVVTVTFQVDSGQRLERQLPTIRNTVHNSLTVGDTIDDWGTVQRVVSQSPTSITVVLAYGK